MGNNCDSKDYLSLKEVAEICGVSYGTIKRDIENGKLPAYRIGRKYFIAKNDVDTYSSLMAEKRGVRGYTIQELMERIPLSYAFLMDLIKTKKLAAVKVGRQYVVPYEAFEAFMKNRKIES